MDYIAKIPPGYLKYLDKKKVDSKDFLVMYQFGPFYIYDPDDMGMLVSIILANKRGYSETQLSGMVVR